MNKLAHVRRQNDVLSREGKRGGEGGKTTRKFGGSEFDWIAVCRHTLKREDAARCPFCKMVTQQLNVFFDKERVSREKAREESVIRRAALRFNLLQSWSKNQPLFYHDLLPQQWPSISTVEISFSRSFVHALMGEADLIEDEEQRGVKRKSDLLDMGNLVNVLRRRRRILEVGAYAAVFLQARIRKWCARRRVRFMLLRRFEYVPPPAVQSGHGRPKEAFFIDTKAGKKWSSYPALISGAKPNTPRTIGRRVGGVERRMEARLQQFNQLMKEYVVDGAYSDLWSREEQYMARMRDFIAFVDVVDSAFRALQRLRENEFSRQGLPAPTDDVRCWISLSAPGPTSRALGMALAFTTPDYRSTHPKAQKPKKSLPAAKKAAPAAGAKAGGKAGLLSSKRAPSSSDLSKRRPPPDAATTPSTSKEAEAEEEEDDEDSGVVFREMNACTAALELRAWGSLQCSTAPQVLQKVLSQEALPAMGSCVHIAHDDFKIWHGFSRTPAQQRQEEAAFKAANPGKTTKAPPVPPESERSHVLPMSLHLRCCPSKADGRGPQSVFRLFFFEGDLVAATQAAVWTWYPNVLKDRDAIASSLLAWAETPETKGFVCGYFSRANANSMEAKARQRAASSSSSSATATAAAAAAARGPVPLNAKENYSSDAKFSTRTHQAVAPFWLPPEASLYELDTYFGKAALTPEETVACSKAYRFLSKVPAFKAGLVKAQNALMRTRRKAEALPSPPMPHAGDARSKDLPTSGREDELRGTALYSGLCVEAPGGHARRPEQYLERLRSHSLLTDPLFQERVVRPEVLSHDHGGLIDLTPPRFDLLVLEVLVSPPPPEDAANANKPPSMAETMLSAKDKEALMRKRRRRRVDLHAVIGMATSDSPRPPPFIDCGLVDWSSFSVRRRDQAEQEQLGKKPLWAEPQSQWTASPPSLSRAADDEDPRWGGADPVTGAMFCRNLKTAAASSAGAAAASASAYGTSSVKGVTIAIVGGLPSLEHLTSEVPRKAQKWMGWV